MYQSIIRDTLGRISGTINEFYNDEDTAYRDYKESELRFPEYRKDFNSPVKVYHISELKQNETKENK